MRTNFYIFLIFLILNIFFINRSESKVIVFDVSKKNIQLSEKAKDPDFIIFGYTDFDEPLVIKIRGPEQKVILQKKTKVLGMWSWRKTGECIYPALFHYYPNKNS